MQRQTTPLLLHFTPASSFEATVHIFKIGLDENLSLRMICCCGSQLYFQLHLFLRSFCVGRQNFSFWSPIQLIANKLISWLMLFPSQSHQQVIRMFPHSSALFRIFSSPTAISTSEPTSSWTVTAFVSKYPNRKHQSIINWVGSSPLCNFSSPFSKQGLLQYRGKCYPGGHFDDHHQRQHHPREGQSASGR